MAHSNRYGRRKGDIELEEELTDGEHDLMTCQRARSYPSHDNAAQRPRSALHAHLQTDGYAQGDERLHSGPTHPAAGEGLTFLTVTAGSGEGNHDSRAHYHAGYQRGESCTGDAHLGQSPVTIDEQPVTENVQRVASKENPHGRLCVGGGIEELLQRVDPTHKGKGNKIDEIVRPHVGQEFFGLSQFVEEKIKDGIERHQKQSGQRVDGHSVARGLTDALRVALSEASPDDRCEAKGKAHGHEQSQDKDIAYE